MGGKKTKPLRDGESLSIIVEACKAAKFSKLADGTSAFVSNWKTPSVFAIMYNSMSNPSEMAKKIMNQIRDMNLMIYMIKVETGGMRPREDIVEELKNLVRNNKDVFPAMFDTSQPSCTISITDSDFVEPALLQLRTEGVKIYSQDGTRPIEMEYSKVDSRSTSIMTTDTQSMEVMSM